MKNCRSYLLVLMVALMAWGCASTPAGKYHQTNEAAIAVIKTAITAKSVDKITQEDWDDFVLPAIVEADSVLVQMREIVDAGGDPYEMEFALQTAINIISRYLE